MAVASCLWCDSELIIGDVIAGRPLCAGCRHVATGVPGLTSEMLDMLPFGVIELSRAGTVLAYNRAEEQLSGLRRESVVERNFFTEVAPCTDVQSFRGRFERFLDGSELAQNFNFAYHFATEVVGVQLTFLRVNREIALVLSRRSTRQTALA